MADPPNESCDQGGISWNRWHIIPEGTEARPYTGVRKYKDEGPLPFVLVLAIKCGVPPRLLLPYLYSSRLMI
jgi:hypothetical protein